MEISQVQFGEIMTKLGSLDEGIKSMHRRQDITNGRIAKNEEKTIDIDKKLAAVETSVKDLDKRADGDDESKKNAAAGSAASKQYWSRLLIERILWAAVALLGIVLTKLGVINIHI